MIYDVCEISWPGLSVSVSKVIYFSMYSTIKRAYDYESQNDDFLFLKSLWAFIFYQIYKLQELFSI